MIDPFNESSRFSRVTYFESSNILVKLEGKNPEEEGLLLSAHFDSVPTGYGATDDGMGVVSLLANLKYHIKHRPNRTLIFNFNNNEEFGLLGASTYFDRSPTLTKNVAHVLTQATKRILRKNVVSTCHPPCCIFFFRNDSLSCTTRDLSRIHRKDHPPLKSLHC